MVDMVEFKAKLRRLCAERGLSQRQLTDLLNSAGFELSKSLVSLWFAGKYFPDLPQAHWLAQHFGVSIDYLGCPDIAEPSEATITPDERQAVAVMRALALSGEEASRRLVSKPGGEPQERETMVPLSGTDQMEYRERELAEHKRGKRNASSKRPEGEKKRPKTDGGPVSRS